jgi:uncharacterized membrane protein YoaK (UPF0700 family)
MEPAKTAVAVVLTFVAGYVDALGWLSLNRVFTAQMSGNAVLLAVHLAAGEQAHAWLQADAMAGFFAGLVIGGSVIEIGMRRRMRRIFVVALAVEFALLAAFAIAGSGLPVEVRNETTFPGWPAYALIAIVAFAMGAQNISLRMAGILSVFTTHVTGVLSGLGEEVIIGALALLERSRRRTAEDGRASEALRPKHRTAFRNIIRSTALLAGFFAGALAGASLAPAAGVAGAIAVPLVLLASVGVFAWVVPLTVFPPPAEQE